MVITAIIQNTALYLIVMIDGAEVMIPKEPSSRLLLEVMQLVEDGVLIMPPMIDPLTGLPV